MERVHTTRLMVNPTKTKRGNRDIHHGGIVSKCGKALAHFTLARLFDEHMR